jgi:hypothetical protein
MTSLPDDRQARLAAIGEQIAAGTYETPDKLEIAVERLWQALEGQSQAEAQRRAQNLPRKPR